MLTTPQLKAFYLDLQDERLTSALGIVHSRFSTNTFPSWPLAHPFRRIAHNGEINTVTGNENWMRAREALISTDVFGPANDVDKLFPICTPGASDTARFDEVLELLHLGGRSLAHAVLMMIPEAWERHESMDPARRAFYQYHASLMEPWDGPASMTFTDGTVVGAVLDRNGLRPSRIWVTSDGLVVMASEAGVLDLDPSKVVRRMRLQPGRMFLVDTAQGRIVEDEEIKAELAAEHPYQEWLDNGLVALEELPQGPYVRMPHHRIVLRQLVFGYTYEELNLLVAPMARTGVEPIGSMGTDTPVAVLSQRPRMLYDYFQQLFAQVTNPPLDAIREEVVTSLQGAIGPEGDLLSPDENSCRQIVLKQPILRNHELAKLVNLDPEEEVNGRRHGMRTTVIRCLYPVAKGGDGLRAALDDVRAQASAAIADGTRIIVLSDRESDEKLAPIPSLLSVAAVHHHLVRERSRTLVGLVVESGDAREVHHMAALIGFGAAAINPYMAFESIEDMLDRKVLVGMDREKALANYVKAAGKGVLKVMSKMGISTLASYTGAQLFQAVGISQAVLDEYFTGLTCPIGRNRPRRHRRRCGAPPRARIPVAVRAARAPRTRGGRRVPVAARRRIPPVQPRHGVQAPTRHPHRAVRNLQGIYETRRRPVREDGIAARAAAVPGGHAAAGVAGGGRTGQRDRQAVLDGSDELRLDLRRGSRNPGDRDEPPWGPLELR